MVIISRASSPSNINIWPKTESYQKSNVLSAIIWSWLRPLTMVTLVTQFLKHGMLTWQEVDWMGSYMYFDHVSIDTHNTQPSVPGHAWYQPRTEQSLSLAVSSKTKPSQHSSYIAGQYLLHILCFENKWPSREASWEMSIAMYSLAALTNIW